MNSVIYTGFMLFLWAVNLFNGTGLGAAYRTTEYARILLALTALLFLLHKVRKEGGCYVKNRYFFVLLPLLLIFVVVSGLNGHGMMGLDYLWVFLVVFILYNTRPTTAALRLVGVAYAVLGLAILFIYQYTDVLKGWNPNSIAMIGLFSFLIFIIPYYGARDFRSAVMLSLIGYAYCFLIWPTESRSCIVTIILSLLLSFRILSVEKTMTSSKGLFLALLVPLMVAGSVAIVSGTGFIAELEQWSQSQLGKPLFNGRDQTWIQGFQQLWKNPLFGSGYIASGVWHNSALACLTAYGIVGYFLWIKLFHMLLREAAPYVKDVCVIGCMTVFMVIYWQQSVELGFFAPNPNLLPYAMLGILLGRINTLRSRL